MRLRHGGGGGARLPWKAHALTPSISIAVVGGIAVAMPVLGLVRAMGRRTRPYSDPLLAGASEPADWLPGSTAQSTSIAQMQDVALSTLQGVLLALTALLIGIGITNLLTLVLTRVAARRSETALRAALGAGRRQLGVQLLREALLPLGVMGCLGVAGGLGVHHLLFRAWPGEAPPLSAGGVDAATLLLALAGFVLLPALAWVSPAGMAGRRDLHRFLTSGTRSTAAPVETLARTGLATLQVGGSVVLLVSGALLLRAFAPSAEASASPGFDPRDTVAVHIRIAADGTADRLAVLERARQRIAGIPGVVDTSLSTPGAWLGVGVTDRVTAVCPECYIGAMIKPVSEGPAVIHAVSRGFFGSLGAPILRGREPGPEDAGSSAAVAVISDTFAHRLFPNGEPLGKRVQVGGREGEMYEVVGVVDDIRATGIGVGAEPLPTLYLPIDRHPPVVAGLAVRVTADPGAVTPAIERALHALGPGIRADGAMAMEEYLARFREPLGWFARVFTLIAVASLVLAASGLHALMSFNVNRRSREMGIRMAVGARARDIVRLVLGQSLRVTAFGAVLGLIATGGVARLLQLLLGGLDPLDPVVLGLVPALLGSVALVASYRPARRASAADPQISLRGD